MEFTLSRNAHAGRHCGRLGHHGRCLTDDTALALVVNTLPTGAPLVVLISILAPISGAHFNPAVSMVMRIRRATARSGAGPYGGQIAGALLALEVFFWLLGSGGI